MATNKLGTLVYDLVADTQDFQKGVVQSRKSLTALKKIFLESRTPVEAFGIQMQGMQKLIESGSRPINMFSRSIADLAVKTKGGGREARAFVESLRQQASQLVESVGHYRVLSKEDRERVDRLRAVARAIEREVDIQRNAQAEKLKSKRATDQESEAAKKLAEELKTLEQERRKQASAIKKQADAEALLLSKQKAQARIIRDRQDPRRALAREMTGIRELGAAGMLSPAEVAVEQKRIAQSLRELNPEYQEQVQQLARVRKGLQNLITPQAKIRTQVKELVQEHRKGNVTYDQTVARIRQLREEYRNLNRVQDKNVASQSKVLQGIRNQTIALAKQVSAITLAYKAIRQLREGFSDALEIGRSQRQFETFTGSAQVASELMLQIRQFTAETPVTMRAAQQSVRTMLQYGVSQSEVVGRLKQLGDISGGSTESLQRLSLAFGQITANTRLQGQELRQLVEAGFNPLMFIAEQTGESMFDLRQRMSEGDLSVREIADALDAATSGAGRFANALKNVGEETAFGRIQRFVSEFEKLRADFMIPITALTGGAASEALDNLEQYRESAREAFRFDAEAGLEAKDLEPALKVLERQGLFGGFKGFSTIGLRMQRRLIEAVIEEQRSAAKARQASLDRELEEFMKPSSKRLEADTELLDVIHERISALRKERDELRLGEDEALLSDLRRQGASDEYINALREEMKLLAEAKRRQKELDDAEKKRHEESLKRQREREMAIEKSERDRARQIETDRRAAEALAKSIQTPLEALEAEMTNIQKVSEFLTVDQRVRLMQQAKERFDKAMQEDAKSQQEATAATRGSVEEFRLLSEINRQQINREQKNHNEAMGARNEGNRLLNLNITGLNLLPIKLGSELSELMGVPVRRPGMPTFGASVSPSAYQ